MSTEIGSDVTSENNESQLEEKILEKVAPTFEDVKDIKIPKKAKIGHLNDDEPLLKRNPYDLTQDSNVPSDLSIGSKEQSSTSNQSTEHAKLVANHYNAVKETKLPQRNQSPIIYMRNFNNWIKSMLIYEYIGKIKQKKNHGDPLRVLDLCCGKGGDLLKWRKSYVTHVILADIADVSIQQCRERYKDMQNNSSRGPPLFTAEFLTQDCTRVRLREKYQDVTIQLDLVSCQFAFHYCFESLSQAECMFKNASETLKPGGFFIGTLPNANEIVSRWKKSDGNSFGNDVYSIDFECDKEKIPPLFGAKYNFHLDTVVNCPEFLVHFPTFCKLAWKFGLQLVLFEKFEDFFERIKNDGKTLLSQMQALEAYPPQQGAPLVGKATTDYEHASEYMQNSSGHRKIGTMSKSEWECITLYSVFAFEKAKTVWNAEGKPEYVKSEPKPR